MGFPVPQHLPDRRYPTGATNALANAALVATAPGWLCAIVGRSGAAQEIQVHDSATAAAEGAAPLYSFPVAANTPFSLVFGEVPMLNGIYVCNSSTVATKTIGSADCLFVVSWRKRA